MGLQMVRPFLRHEKRLVMDDSILYPLAPRRETSATTRAAPKINIDNTVCEV